MQVPLTSLLLITAAVLLTCVVIDYSVNVVQNTINTRNSPEIDKIKNLENNVLNQTNNLLEQNGLANSSQTTPQTDNSATP